VPQHCLGFLVHLYFLVDLKHLGVLEDPANLGFLEVPVDPVVHWSQVFQIAQLVHWLQLVQDYLVVLADQLLLADQALH
jgi:hypothetical protein